VNYAGTATDSDGTIASWSWTFAGGTPGSASVEDPGAVIYSTAGVYTTTFIATDDGGLSCTPATVQITVNTVGGNNVPVASNDSYSMDQDTVLNVAAPGVLGNDSDGDNDPLTAVQLSGALNGVATLNADGSFSYTPTPGFIGNDSFTYVADDGTDQSNLATVNITVNSTGQMACSDYTAKGDCNNDVNCEWSGSPRNGTCNDVAVCTPTTEICNDGIDNDCNELIDCADTAACGADPACAQADCTEFLDKNSCNAQTTCSWSNKNKVCQSI
jgi:hypothetical protein